MMSAPSLFLGAWMTEHERARRARDMRVRARPAVRRWLASAAVGDFSAATVLHDGGRKALVAARGAQSGEELFRFTGVLQRGNHPFALQVGTAAYLVCHAEPQPWCYLDHSFSPSVRLQHAPVASVDAVPPTLTATAAVDLAPGDFLTIDYTLHEWDMDREGFVCAESGRRVRGFRHLAEAEQDAALPFALPHVKQLHLQHLFGQSSRC